MTTMVGMLVGFLVHRRGRMPRWLVWLLAGAAAGLVAGFAAGLIRPRMAETG